MADAHVDQQPQPPAAPAAVPALQQQQVKLPVPALQQFLPHPGEQASSIDQWLTQFELYLDIINCNRPQMQQMEDREKNILLCTNLGLEGLRTFSGTDSYKNKADRRYDDFKKAVIDHFSKKKSRFIARLDCFQRKQEASENVRDYVR